ncbi:glycosyltransferase family 4 protein [Maritimibacter sp. 55A14]|uniref:glycosyltransferase family 4 protein n=1 Tax=Maritimibacter sp. 55A14 TaxID=2174844 RepID=UPI0013050014|nr:glycosyltransferase family 4 protein [Maritimibacter sp. 55A14]
MVAELVRTQPNHNVLVFDGSGSFFDLGKGHIIEKKGLIRALLFCLANRGRYDVFHLHMAPAVYFANLLGRKAVMQIHSYYNARWENPVNRVLLWMACRRSKATIAVNAAAARSIRHYFGNVPRLHALTNFCVDLKTGAPEPGPRMSGRARLLMVASLARPKRQDIAIQALARLPDDYDLVLAGTGEDEDQLRRLAEELGLLERVSFAGAVKDVARLYQAADMCLLLSDWEGFGLVVIEAAQFGVPTIVNNIEGLRQSCPDPRFIASELAPEAVARKITEVASLKKQMDMTGVLESYWKQHSVDAYVARLETIYRSDARICSSSE